MSRRKQARPQCVHLEPPPPTDNADFCVDSSVSLSGDVHVCKNCCAEFFRLSDLHEHQMNCSQYPLILIVSGDGHSTSPSSSFTFNSPTHSTDDQTNNSTGTDDTEGLYDKRLEENRKSPPVSDTNGDDVSHFHLDIVNNVENQIMRSSILTSESSTVVPQPDSLPEPSSSSSTSSNVVIGTLDSTKVAVAQFPQDVCLNAVVNTTNLTNCNMTITSLIKRLVTVQQQQVLQLKLIEQIRQHILLLSARNTDTSAPSGTCRGTSEISQTGLLITLSSHLSQQLAEAAGLAQSLVSQAAGITKVRRLKHAVFSSSQDSTVLSDLADTDKSKLGICPSEKQSDHDQDTFPTQLSGTSQSPSPVSADSTPNLTNNLSLPHSPNGNDIFKSSLPSIGAIVEDFNALTALAQQSKGKLPNMTSFGHKRPFDEGLFKHKCRFCAKVFGSDSALQIHLRSHTGERPYKCNICGNRFSTRGNLKVHFQRHKGKYPNIQMNPYPVPEHLDNVPTSTGIPYGMSVLPGKPASKCLGSKPSVTSLPGLLLTSSLPSLPSIIKREAQVVPVGRVASPGASGLNGLEIFENGNKEEASHDHFLAVNGKYKELEYLSTQTYLNSSGNVSEDHTSRDSAPNLPNSSTPILHQDIKPALSFGDLPDCMDTSETIKLERLVENIDKKNPDPNECMICHRVLSCQSALKMHYRTHTGERPFKCKICGRAFTTKGNLKTHYSVHCDMPPVRVQHSCPICQEKYTNAMVLQQHIRMHMVKQFSRVTLPEHDQESLEHPDTCLVERRTLDENLSDEYMEITEGFFISKDCTSSQDSTCSLSTSSHTEAEKITQDNNKTNLLNDKVENKSFDEDFLSFKSCFGNENASQRSKTPVCPENAYSWDSFPKNCSKDSLRSSAFEVNAKSSDAELRSLLQPDLKFNSTPADVLKGGMTIRYNSGEQGNLKNNACDVCNKTFACQSALDIHYRSHTKERPFLCTVCYKGFSTKGNLKQHMLTHQLRDLPLQLSEQDRENLVYSPNPYMGHLVCSKIKMESNSILNKDCKDAVVGMMNSSAPTLMALSAPLAPSRKTFKQHLCRTCGKTFSSSSALQIHERTHTGEKPFVCTVCGRAFTTKGNLKVHMGTHMWNGSPARRGRRLSVEGPFTVIKSNTVQFTDMLPKEAASTSGCVGFWNQYITAPLSTGLALKTNEISVIQNRSIPQASLSDGRGGNSPVGGLTAGLDRTMKRDDAWSERTGENGPCFHTTPFIEESSTD